MLADEKAPKEGEEEKTEGDAATEGEEGAEGKDGEEPKKKSKVMLFIIIGVVLLLAIGGFVTWKFFLSGDGEEGKQNEEEVVFDPEKASFLEIPEMLINLRSIKSKGSMLKIALTMQLMNKEDDPKIKEYEPLIIDACMTFLREQSVIDLEGGGIERIRQELLIRINNIIKPLKVHKLMIRDFFVQ